MKTDIDIKDEVYAWLKKSALMEAVTGSLCTRLRPLDSEKEDVVISVIANEFAQTQQATIQVNIYVKDITFKGRNEENTARIRELAKIAYETLKVRNNDYRITLSNQRVIDVESIGYHVINNRLSYQYYNDK